MKKVISLALVIMYLLSSSVNIFAYTASNVPSYLFDATYYSEKYEDLRMAFGTNKAKLYNHWCDYGIAEGRSPSPVYNPTYYVNKNADLKQAFGMNYTALYNHFCVYGINEFRASSEIYDGTYYKNAHADLQNAYGSLSKRYLEHFMTYGMNEGRQASEGFNLSVYRENYNDLQQAYGDNLKAYYYHYMNYGISEGRKATRSDKKNTVSNPSEQQERTAWVKTSGSNLNMRKSASASSRLVCKIPNGSQITVYGNSTNGFYKVKYGNYTGYASASYISFSKEVGSTGNLYVGLISQNLSKVKLIKQGSKTCKATAVAQSLNIIVGSNAYTTSKLGNASCKSINGQVYIGSDGNRYKATYKTDSYKGSASEQMSQINSSVAAGLPIVVTVHKKSAGTKHHWVTIIGKNGNDYTIIDPATGTKRTMSGAGYEFGLADYSNGYHYGYVSFKRI